MARNYNKEYANYQGTPEQIKKRASRNKARRMMIKLGLAKKGDGRDVDHQDGNPKNNKRSNLVMMALSDNRSFARNKRAGKK